MGIDNPILSSDRRYSFKFQSDGNLVLYDNNLPTWNSGTYNSGIGGRVIMQSDGNLVLYNTNSQPIWSSVTSGPGARLTTQTDGNLVIYNQSNVPLWGANTTHNPDHLGYVNSVMFTARLYPNQRLETADRRFRLILQPDGNLVLYSPNRAIWSSVTAGKSVAYLASQPDGNLVLYDTNNQPVWHAGSNGNGYSYLAIQPDGNLVLYQGGSNRPTWHSNTAGIL